MLMCEIEMYQSKAGLIMYPILSNNLLTMKQRIIIMFFYFIVLTLCFHILAFLITFEIRLLSDQLYTFCLLMSIFLSNN